MITSEQANEVAKTIYSQIGNKAFTMMGADHFGSGIEDDQAYLQFKIKGCKHYNYIKVTLTPSDTYTVCFLKATPKRGITKKVPVAGVYFDQLKPVIEERTGLYLTL